MKCQYFERIKVVLAYPVFVFLIVFGCFIDEIQRAWYNFDYIQSMKTEFKKSHTILEKVWKGNKKETVDVDAETQIESLKKVVEEKTNRIHELENQLDEMWRKQ